MRTSGAGYLLDQLLMESCHHTRVHCGLDNNKAETETDRDQWVPVLQLFKSPTSGLNSRNDGHQLVNINRKHKHDGLHRLGAADAKHMNNAKVSSLSDMADIARGSGIMSAAAQHLCIVIGSKVYIPTETFNMSYIQVQWWSDG